MMWRSTRRGDALQINAWGLYDNDNYELQALVWLAQKEHGK